MTSNTELLKNSFHQTREISCTPSLIRAFPQNRCFKYFFLHYWGEPITLHHLSCIILSWFIMETILVFLKNPTRSFSFLPLYFSQRKMNSIFLYLSALSNVLIKVIVVWKQWILTLNGIICVRLHRSALRRIDKTPETHIFNT